MTEEPKRMTPTERLHDLAHTLAERRSAATSYVNIKVSAQGALQPDVNITPDTQEEDADRMTAIALKQVNAIMQAAGNGKPPTETKGTKHG